MLILRKIKIGHLAQVSSHPTFNRPAKGISTYTRDQMKVICIGMLTIVELPKTDSPYYGNLHNADKSPWSRIIPYTIV